jgi:type II secretory pathway pseudopilin PulG
MYCVAMGKSSGGPNTERCIQRLKGVRAMSEPRDLAEPGASRRAEAGFTLVEALCAIVILIFGLIAITNLLLVAASSNSVANQSSAATASASQALDFLRTVDFDALAVGGAIVAAPPLPAAACTAAVPTDYACFEDVPGVGRIVTQWTIQADPATTRLRFITVASEGTGALAGARSRAMFTTIRTCTDSSTPPAGRPFCPVGP